MAASGRSAGTPVAILSSGGCCGATSSLFSVGRGFFLDFHARAFLGMSSTLGRGHVQHVLWHVMSRNEISEMLSFSKIFWSGMQLMMVIFDLTM